jgi:hypothetical protein
MTPTWCSRPSIGQSPDPAPFTSPEELAYYVTSDLHRWLFDVPDPPTRPQEGAGDRSEAENILAAIKTPISQLPPASVWATGFARLGAAEHRDRRFGPGRHLRHR